MSNTRMIQWCGVLAVACWGGWVGGAETPPIPEDVQTPESAVVEAPGSADSANGGVTAPLTTFAQRREWILDAVAANPKSAIHDSRQPFFAAEACFLRGKNDAGRELARNGYLYWSKQDPLKVRATDFFRLWPAMDCYVRWKDRLDEESKASFKRFMTSITCYSYGYTANLSMLMWTTRLLGGQEWGDAAFAPMKRDTTSHYKANPDISMKTRLMGMVNAQALTGGEEYASRPYGAGNLAPILCLAQLAQDPELKLHARIAHETALARYAPVWLSGAMIITSRRSYPDLFNDPMGVAEWFWVFFGGEMCPGIGGHALEAAVLGEAAPRLIEQAAADRCMPYTALNRFQESSHGRQISWLTHDFGLFSESYYTNPRAFGQTYPFGVRWVEPRSPHLTILWFSVPVVDEARKGAFPASHPHGFNPSAQSTYQHEGSLLYVVDTAKARYPYGLSFIPGGALAVIDEAAANGRVFLHYPGVFIAFTATKPFPWDRTAPIKYASGTPRAGDSEFRVPGPVFAVAIETAPVAEFPGATPEERLKCFRDTIVAKTKLELAAASPLTGSYTDRRGTIICRELGSVAQVNGKPVDFDHWPMADSPWVKQAAKNSPLTVTDGKTIRTYDLQNWTIKDEAR